MRPPEFTGGNQLSVPVRTGVRPNRHASMRPPEFTGGNRARRGQQRQNGIQRGFNEAAGIHRRKLIVQTLSRSSLIAMESGFNEAAGIHRRKQMQRRYPLAWVCQASMRPPEFTGGNRQDSHRSLGLPLPGFNEAAGIHRRKRLAFQATRVAQHAASRASMRPPEFTGGNAHYLLTDQGGVGALQ